MALDIFIMTDQPETCRQCGTRTEFEDLSKGKQIHRCSNCQFTYILEDGTIPCVKCGSTDVMEDLFDGIPTIICKSCRTFFHCDDEVILNHIDSTAYFGGQI
jgi:rubredoxin